MRRAARLTDHPQILVAALAAVVFAGQSLAWPLAPGRDAGNYLRYYLEVWVSDPVLPDVQLAHMPLAPVVYGLSLEYLGAIATEIIAGLMFVASVSLLRAAAAVVSERVGTITAVVAACFPPYAALFHQVSTDAPYALAFAALAAVLARACVAPTASRFAAAGVVATVGVFTRPSALVLLPLIGIALLVLPPARLRQKLVFGAAFTAAAVVPLLAWALLNGIRHEYFGLLRGGNAGVPLFRLLAKDRLVEPGNGPETRRLAKLVRERLVPLEPYRSFGVTADEALTSGSSRVYSDLVVLSDREWGWDHNYRRLRAVGFEAIRAHQATYVRSVTRSLAEQFAGSYSLAAPKRAAKPAPPSVVLRLPARRVNGRLVPVLTEGEPIPAAHMHLLYTRPDNAIDMDWSNLARPRLTFADPELRRRFLDLERRLNALVAEFPNRSGSEPLVRVLNGFASVFPPPALWLLVGIAGLVVARSRAALILATPAALGVAVVVFTAASQPPFREYRLPFDPGFVLFGVAGLAALAPRLRR